MYYYFYHYYYYILIIFRIYYYCLLLALIIVGKKKKKKKKMMMMGSKRTICSCPNPTEASRQLGDIAWKNERNFAFQDKKCRRRKTQLHYSSIILHMKTVINYKLQDDIIGRQTRRFESRKKFEKQLLEEILSGDTDDQLNEDAAFAAKQAALRTGKRKEKTKQEEAYEIVEAAKLKGPRELVRVMQGNSRNPFIQAKGCWCRDCLFSMRERHARYEGMFTFRRSSEVQPLKNMNLTLGKIGALNCVQQALIKHRANKQVVWRLPVCAMASQVQTK